MTLEYINCNLCGSNQSRVSIILSDLLNIVQCENCGLIYRNPRFSENEILENYSSDGVFVEHLKAVWDYSKNRLFKQNLKRIEGYCPSKGRLLDVGCGYGTFLNIAEESGWDVRGIEISESAFKYASQRWGLKICKGTLKEAKFPDNYFDVVSLWEVLSLVCNPKQELKEAKRILKDGGLVALRLHNAVFHVFMHRFFRCLGNLNAKLHINPTIFHNYNFSPGTIREILEKAGFEEIKIFVSELTAGDPYSTGGILGNFGLQIIKKIIFYFSKLIFYLTGGKLVWGPSIIVFARKPNS